MANTLELFNQLKEEGKSFLKKKQPIKAFFPFEQAYNLIEKKDSELEELLLESSYKGIWGAYGGEQYELMEYLARFTIHLAGQGNQDTDNSQIMLKLAKAYNGLAIAMYRIGKRSIEFNKKSSSIYEELITKLDGDKSLKDIVKSKIKNDFGLVINLGYDGHFDEAKSYADKSIQLSRHYNLKIEEALSYKILGNLLFYFQQYEDSFSYLLKSADNFSLLKTKEAKRRLGETYLLICENYFKINQFDQGKIYLNKADQSFQQLNEHPYLYYALAGSYFDEQKNLSLAKQSYLQAIAILNVSKWGVHFESNIDSFLGHKDKETIYLKAISSLLRDGQFDKGFELFESFRSKLFIENVLSGKRENMGGIPLPLKKEREGIIKKLEKLYSSKTYQDNYDEINDLEKQLYYCDEKIASIKGGYRAFSDTQLNSLQDCQKNIPKNALIVEYFYYLDQLYIFLINQDLFEVISVNVSSNELEELISTYLNSFKKEFQNPNWQLIEDFYKQKSIELLIAPIKPHLNAIEEIAIVPYKILHSFPMHHLFLSVFETIKVFYLPNFQSINLLKNYPLNFTRSLLIGDPRENLEGSLEEVQAVSELFSDSSTFIGKEAEKEIILKQLTRHPIIHYSGHIRFNPKRPLYSYLECSEIKQHNHKNKYPGFNEEKSGIFLKEIYQLCLEDVKFLSLSGCSSGVATQYRGEELIGLVRGFFYSGVQSILATLWDIEDQSGKDFLICFFKKTMENNGNKKQGFLEAYHIMKQKYKHSFFYGGFSLYEGF